MDAMEDLLKREKQWGLDKLGRNIAEMERLEVAKMERLERIKEVWDRLIIGMCFLIIFFVLAKNL